LFFHRTPRQIPLRPEGSPQAQVEEGSRYLSREKNIGGGDSPDSSGTNLTHFVGCFNRSTFITFAFCNIVAVPMLSL
jgi:hypothetical protein